MAYSQAGEKNSFSKLSQDDVDRIRGLASEGFNNVDIAFKFNITSSHVSNIIHRRIWNDGKTFELTEEGKKRRKMYPRSVTKNLDKYGEHVLEHELWPD